jgi:hypothetical protein
MHFEHGTRRAAVLHCAFVAIVALACAGLLIAAALAPAPAVVQPVIVVACVGFAMAVATELPESIRALRSRLDERALEMLRGQLDELPETEHPLGL